MRTPLRPPQKGGPKKYSAHVYCGQTAGWMQLVLGMEVGLGPRHIVLDGDPAPLQKTDAEPPPIFGPFLLWPRPLSVVAKGLDRLRCHGWMHRDATWYGGRPQTRRLCVRWGPSPCPKRSGAPHFSAHVYCGQTAGWMKTPLGREVDLGPGHFVLDGFPAIGERGTAVPSFRPMPVVHGHDRPSQLLLSSCCVL